MAVSIKFQATTGCRLTEDGSFLLEPVPAPGGRPATPRPLAADGSSGSAPGGGKVFGLPQLTFAPTGDNVPHLFSVEARIDGLGDAAQLSLFEQYVMPEGKLVQNPPLRLSRPRTLAPGLIDLADEPLAERIEFTVTVGYYDSTPDGQPQQQVPLQEVAAAVMRLPPGWAERLARGPASIEVSPRHKVLHEGEPLALTLRLTTSGPDPRPPTTTLGAGSLDPALARLITTALAAPARRLPVDRQRPGETYWEQVLRIEPDGATRRRLAADPAAAVQRIELVSRFGSAQFTHGLEIDFRPATDKFADWICIDFGTSNSAVALFDQKRVPTPVGLPREQLDQLAEALRAWFRADPKDAVGTVPGVADEWRLLLQEIAEGLPEGGPEALIRPLRTRDERRMLDILRRIETASLSPPTRRAVVSRLDRILQQTFRTPALSQQTIFPVELDQASGAATIPSETEVLALNPLGARIGEQARNNRRQAEANGVDTQGRFHISCKQYLGTGQGFPVSLDEQQAQQVPYDALIREGWRDLVRCTDAYRERHKEQHKPGRICKAIVTYPTISPPSVRRRIGELAREIGIDSPNTLYDEAVAAAVFYLMRDLGGEMDFGIESFESRSRPLGDQGRRWVQNVLVFDIGGGTTDIALIRLLLEDQTEPVRHAEGAAESAGGRYYKMTPEVLGSSGHMQLGGDLITLRTFRGLKALLAEQVLARYGETPRIKAAVASFGDALREGHDGGYAPGRLVSLVREGMNAEADRRGSDYEAALTAVDQLIPTRWDGRSGDERTRARQCFNLLWTLAENAKLAFGRRGLGPDGPAPAFEPSRADLEEVLAVIGLDAPPPDGQRIALALDRGLFEDLIRPAVRQAARIARGLLESRLPPRPGGQGGRREPLDWLILSGQTCHLTLVDKELRRELEDAQVFHWNPDRVTFDPQYAKLATSVGACWAEHLRLQIADPKGSAAILRRGSSLLHFDVKNLFFFLPCRFVLRAQGGDNEPLFDAHDKLRRLDDEDLGKARTDWKGAMLKLSVLRKDFETQDFAHHWCDFDASELAADWGMGEEQWRAEMRFQVEVDQLLNMRLFLCRGLPHYQVAPGEFSLRIPADAPLVRTADAGQPVLACDVVVGVNSGGNTQGHQVIFKAGTPFDRCVHRGHDDPEAVPAMISERLPQFNLGGYHIVHVGAPDQHDWTEAGIIRRPGPPSDYEQFYYATLDSEGQLSFHAGEVPYWTADWPEVMRAPGSRGRVLVVDPLPTRPAPEDDRNPFCGRH